MKVFLKKFLEQFEISKVYARVDDKFIDGSVLNIDKFLDLFFVPGGYGCMGIDFVHKTIKDEGFLNYQSEKEYGIVPLTIRLIFDDSFVGENYNYIFTSTVPHSSKSEEELLKIIPGIESDDGFCANKIGFDMYDEYSLEERVREILENFKTNDWDIILTVDRYPIKDFEGLLS